MAVIIVTGGSGFIGSHVVRGLISKGHDVIALSTGKTGRNDTLSEPNYRKIAVTDFKDPSLAVQLRELMPSGFIHCAWRGVAGSERNQAWQLDTNIEMTIDVLRLARDSGCATFTGLGSQAEYGALGAKIAPTAQCEPTTLYGVAKLLASQLTLAFCKANAINGSILRVFSTYGNNDSPAWLLPYVTQKMLANEPVALTKCEQRWDYLHVNDAAEAVIQACLQHASGIFNLGSGVALPLKQYIEKLAELTETTSEINYGEIAYRPDQVMHLEADIELLTSKLNWTPQVEFDVGAKWLVEYEKTRVEK